MTNSSDKAACRVQLALQVVKRPAVGVEFVVCQLCHAMEFIPIKVSEDHEISQQLELKLGQNIQQPLPTSCSRVFRMSTYCMKPHILLPHLLGRLQFKAFKFAVITSQMRHV
jgi:hypothetical protein